jgi:RNA polymerase primary sigma factor
MNTQTKPKKNFNKEARIDFDLFEQYKNGSAEARDQLILRQEDVVKRYAYKHSKWSNSCGYDDLIQEGWIGVMKSLDAYNPEMGVPFNYYSSRWCDAMIRKSIYKNGRTIRTPISTAGVLNKIRASTATLAGQLGREATNAELAEDLGMTEARVKKYKRLEVKSFSLDNQVNSEGESISGGVMNLMPVSGFTPDEALVHDEIVSEVYEAIDNVLSDTERNVLLDYYGIHGHKKTLEELGDELGFTRQGIRSIRCRAQLKVFKTIQKNEIEA